MAEKHEKHSSVSFKVTDEFTEWLDGLVEEVGTKNRINTIWRALKTLAAAHGYDKPMPNE
jgi:hypothetical protein